MNTIGLLRIGYVLADPGLDLARHEACRLQVERAVRALREVGHEVSLVAVQSGQVVLTDTGLGLQQFFEAARCGANPDSDSFSRPSALFSTELLELAREQRFPADELTTSDLAFCAGRRVFRGCHLIHTRLSAVDVGSALCARALGTPLVVEVHTLPLVDRETLYRDRLHERTRCLAGYSATRALGDAKAVVTVSTTIRDRLVSEWAVPRERIAVLPNGADAPPPTSEERMAQLRREYELCGRPSVIFIGDFQPWPGLDVLLEALVAVRANHPEVVLLVVGDGPQLEEMEERALSLGLADSVRFISGVAPELKGELLAVAEVAVVPRLPIEFAFSSAGILELMAAGKAIVASREGQVGELLVDEQTALLVEPGNREELARAIERLLGETDLRRRLGDHARYQTKRDHSWTDYARQLTRIYESVLHHSNGLQGGEPASRDSGR